MAANRWTFLLVRGDDSPVKQFSFSARRLRSVVWTGSILGAVGFGLVATSGLEGVARLRARQLSEQNEALVAELGRFNERVQALEAVLDQVAENDANFRSIAGLEAIDPEVLQAGVGGPGLGSPEVSSLWPLDAGMAQATFATSYDLSAIERRARLLSESLEEAMGAVTVNRD